MPASRMGKELEMASREKSKHYNLKQVIKLREVGYMDQSVPSNTTLNDSWIQHAFDQFDLDRCPDW